MVSYGVRKTVTKLGSVWRERSPLCPLLPEANLITMEL